MVDRREKLQVVAEHYWEGAAAGMFFESNNWQVDCHQHNGVETSCLLQVYSMHTYTTPHATTQRICILLVVRRPLARVCVCLVVVCGCLWVTTKTGRHYRPGPGVDRSYLLMGASPQTPTAASRTLPSLPIREAGGTPNGRGSSVSMLLARCARGKNPCNMRLISVR